MKRTIYFLDANKNKCQVTFDTERNHYSFTGECNGSSGQCLDEIKPNTPAQQELIDNWKNIHLKDLPTNAEECSIRVSEISNLLDAIVKEEQERVGENTCAKLSDDDILNYLISLGDNSPAWCYITKENEVDIDDDVKTAIALAKSCNIALCDLGDIENERDNYWNVQGQSYLAGNDNKMDNEWDDALDNYLDECVLPDLPDTAQRYFDKDSWKNDAKNDGRGHSLNRYDGGEDEEEVLGETIYIYRQ
jgi:hypothetical protein